MKILGVANESREPERPNGVGRSYLCGRARNKSTRKSCKHCFQRICPYHLKYICIECSDGVKHQMIKNKLKHNIIII